MFGDGCKKPHFHVTLQKTSLEFWSVENIYRIFLYTQINQLPALH